MIVGLAPAAHGGTRTGRVFTGDKSSDFLAAKLYYKMLSFKFEGEDVEDNYDNTYVANPAKGGVNKFDLNDDED